MKKHIILVVFLFSIFSSNAIFTTIGGEWSIQWVSPNTYRIKLNHYRDCNATGDFQSPIPVVIYDLLTNAVIDSFCMSLKTRETISFDDSCYRSNVCTELGIYDTTLTIPSVQNGCYISYGRCCRSLIIFNIENPGSISEEWYAEFPDPAVHNSLPEFGSLPQNGHFCGGKINTLDFSAKDADGDSLVYSLVLPLRNIRLNDFAPFIISSSCAPYNPPNDALPIPDPGPYDQDVWQPPYSIANIVGGIPAMAINKSTGILTANPVNLGTVVFCVLVEEYRNKIKIGEVRKDAQYDISICLPCVNGTTNITNDDFIYLSPNPAPNQLTIHTSSFHNEAATVSIMNVLGQTSPPASLHVERGEALIDVSRLAAGMYFLQLKTESGRVVKRFAKE